MDDVAATVASLDLSRWTRLAGVGVAIATFAGFDEEERFLVRSAPSEPTVPSASTIALHADDAGTLVVVALEGGDARRPVILGRLQRSGEPQALAVRADGDRLVLKADREIELRCGESSIVLTRAGKVLIKGNYVLSRSRGANRIKGAYVDIN